MDPSFLTRRYRSLGLGELCSALLFPVLLLWFAVCDGTWSDWIGHGYAVAVVRGILLQGVVWWRWRLRLLREGRRIMRIVARLKAVVTWEAEPHPASALAITLHSVYHLGEIRQALCILEEE